MTSDPFFYLIIIMVVGGVIILVADYYSWKRDFDQKWAEYQKAVKAIREQRHENH